MTWAIIFVISVIFQKKNFRNTIAQKLVLATGKNNKLWFFPKKRLTSDKTVGSFDVHQTASETKQRGILILYSFLTFLA